jgi:cytidylate kinase
LESCNKKNRGKFSDKKEIITIDGPAGSGKSTIAKLLSKELGLKYIDTGATYRTITLLALQNNIEPEDEVSILKLAEKSKIELESQPVSEQDYTIVRLNGKDVTKDIRSDEVGAAVSIVSTLSGVRKLLVKLQRELSIDGKAVLEGRDTGSVVIPDAILKIYLTADEAERVRRRELQNKQKGQSSDSKQIKKEISSRDRIDSSRKDSPLVIPEDAVIIDSTRLSIREVFEKIRDIYNERIHSKNCTQ